MSIINSQPRIGAAGQSTGFKIERSLRFNSADSAYLNRTPASAGNRRTWTFSAWVKKSVFASQQGIFGAAGSADIFIDNGSSTFGFDYYDTSANRTIRYTAAVYRDPSAWYHVVLALDTTQATDSNRIKLYVNGVDAALSTAAIGTWPAQNSEGYINSTEAHSIGRRQSTAGSYFNGYLTEVNFIDGSALTPSSFGETDTDTGVWKPKAYSGSYGTNGFYLKFADNSGTTSTTLGKDSSGNGNNWTPNNFSVTAGSGNDSLVDTPTPYGTDTGAGGEVRGNYATLNPLDNGGLTLSNGNITVARSASGWLTCRSTFGMSSGKWYWEYSDIYTGTSDWATPGIAKSTAALNGQLGADSSGWIYIFNGNKYTNSTQTSYGATWNGSNVIGVAFDADAGTLTFYKDGVSQGTAFSSLTSGPYFPAISMSAASGTLTSNVNFGQRPFAYTAPSGFKALCTTNLPTPTIGATASTRADDYFNTVLYTGDSNSTGATRSVSGVGFQPDFVWLKTRNATFSHQLYDAVRGTGSSKNLSSDRTAAEGDSANLYGYVSAFQTDGFQTTNGTSGTDSGIWVNALTQTFVAWNWKANGSGSSNTSGTITSTVSANTTAGFSIVTYTGTGSNATVGHGLGVAPSFIICKERNTAGYDWRCYHASLGATKYIDLNSTAAAATASTIWQDTAPTTTLFSVGTNGSVNVNTGSYVAYCFSEVAAYSKFGSYVGNGSSDGTFVYTGFRPALIILKVYDGTASWLIHDNKRNTYNVVDKKLFPNGSDAEATADVADFLSNGFKLKGTNTQFNGSGYNYIYAAFAEVPTKFALAR